MFGFLFPYFPSLFFAHIGNFLFSRDASAQKFAGAAGVSRAANVGNETKKKSRIYHWFDGFAKVEEARRTPDRNFNENNV